MRIEKWDKTKRIDMMKRSLKMKKINRRGY